MKRQGFGNWERAVDESIEQLRMLRIFVEASSFDSLATVEYIVSLLFPLD